MNFVDLDLIIIKHLLSSKKNALEFAYEGNDRLFSPDIWKFCRLILDYVRAFKEVPTKKILIERAQSSNHNALIKYIEEIWTALEKVSIDEREFHHELEKLKNRYTEKLIYNLKDRLVSDDGRVDIQKSISELHTAVGQIKTVNKTKSYEQKSLKEGLKEFRENYSNKLRDPNFGIGTKTGYSFFDFVTSGLFESEVLLIGAETNGGKSLLLSNISCNMFLGDNNIEMADNFKEAVDILYFSLEMPFKDCQQRIMARLAMVPETSIRDATLTKEELERLAKTTKFIANYPYDFTIIDMPRGATMENVELILRDITATKGRKPKVVVIDYLTLMSCDEEEADWLKTGRLAEMFHELARTERIIGLTATQLNRAKPGTASPMNMDRIARSSLQAANVNFVLLIEKRQNEKDLPDFRVSLVKNRRGALVDGRLYKKLDCCAILNDPPDNMNTSDDISLLME